MKNVNKKKFSKIMIFTLILAISVSVIYSISVFANVQTEKSNSIEEVVGKYIDNMKNQNFNGVIEMINSKDVGYDAQVYNYKIMNESVNEPDRASKLASASLNDVIANQYGYIKEKFGPNAWDNVTYNIIKKNCPSKREEFVNTETGQTLSEKEAVDQADNYWKDFAKKKGIEYAEFLNIKEFSGEFNEEENMNILIAKELGYQPPVKVNLVDEYDFYEVHLSFNGDTETSDGENSFRISVDNKTGIFKIFQGLRWSVPLSDENMKDI